MKRTRCRRLTASLLSLALVLSLSMFFPLPHAQALDSSRAIEIQINGDPLTIPPSFGAPFYDANERTQIPLRYIIEACGYEVDWDASLHAAVIYTTRGTIEIRPNSKIMKTPSGNVTMDTVATIRNGRTYIPLRFALEALGFTVGWSAGPEADIISVRGEIGKNSTKKSLSASQVSAAASSAVFYVEVYDVEHTAIASGSGFFIDPAGIGVTNYHVLDGASYATLTMTNGVRCEIRDILYYDTDWDIAIFQVHSTESGSPLGQLPYLQLALQGSVHNGDTVYAIGSPFGLQNTITNGIVSNRDRILEGRALFQISAPISPGSSGGALLNEYGEVIGINSSGLAEGQNINFAIPLSSALAPSGLATATATSLEAVCRQEFIRYLNATAGDFAEYPVYEEDPTALNPLQSILNGDTVMGTFADYYAMDYYVFYTPIPVHVSIIAGGFSVDKPKNQQILSSFIMTLDREFNGETYLNSTRRYDAGGAPMNVLEATLSPGYYYISALQSLNQPGAWDGYQYYIYLNMTPAG